MHTATSSISLAMPARYVPGFAYPVTVTINLPQSARNGFEIIPVAGGSTAGSLASRDVKTQVSAAGYGKHTATGNAFTTWTLDWTAPGAGRGTVTLYGAGNASNSSFSADVGDRIVTGTASSTENLEPTIPTLVSPADGSVLVTDTPTLEINESTDGNGDPLVYTFQVCSNSACTSVVETSSAQTPSGGAATWQPAALANENGLYWWRARATDGYVAGDYMSPVSFWVDTVAQPPSRPTITEPMTDGQSYATTSPTFAVANAVDPDPLSVRPAYDFEVFFDAGFSTLVTSATGRLEDPDGTTEWQATGATGLVDAQTYFLRVIARDGDGNASPATTASFTVNLTNNPPAAPGNLAPSGVTLATSTPTLSADAAFDPDGDTLDYYFQIDTTTTFTGGLRVDSGALAAPSWTVSPALTDGKYHWRIWAHDGATPSPVTSAVIWIEAVNDPPGKPLPSSPGDGAVVNTRRPVLTAEPATDPEGDPLEYVFEVAGSNTFASPITALIQTDTDGRARFMPTLTDNATYFWRVFAREISDGTQAGPSSDVFTFSIVNGNTAPEVPVLADETVFAAGQEVSLSAAAPADAEGDELTLEYEFYADSNLELRLAASPAIAPDAAWKPGLSWVRGTYYWRARAADPQVAGAWSDAAKLVIEGRLPFGDHELPSHTTRLATRQVVVPKSGCASGGGGGFGWLFLAVPMLMLRRRAALRVFAITGWLAGCGTEETKDVTVEEQVPLVADYEAVRAIFDARCVGCHFGEEAAAGIDLTDAGVMTTLVGKAPSNPVAADRGWLRVKPAEPDASFIMYKITQPELGQGERMPRKLPPLSEDDVEIIRRWIADGADL